MVVGKKRLWVKTITVISETVTEAKILRTQYFTNQTASVSQRLCGSCPEHLFTRCAYICSGIRVCFKPIKSDMFWYDAE